MTTDRRALPASTHAVLAVLTMGLVAAFVWWRLGAQRHRVESYWTIPLRGSATTYSVRANEWLTAHRHTADVLGQLAARSRAPGSAFEATLAAALSDGDVPVVSLRDGDRFLLCTGIPLAQRCEPGSEEFDVLSPEDPRAQRARPMSDGRVLVPVVALIPPHGSSPGGALVVWMDPEITLLPRLLRFRGGIPDAKTFFVRRTGDSATVLSSGGADGPPIRKRIARATLPSVLGRTMDDSALIVGVDDAGKEAIASRIFIPRIQWEVYRVLARDVAKAPFSRQLRTEGLLFFALGSLVIGAIVWAVHDQRQRLIRAELLQARVESLQAQLRPHFLFNALNTIATLVHEDIDAADAMLRKLADLLRLSLEHSDSAVIPLRTEVEILDAYLDVERVRFGDCLRMDKNIDPDVLDAPVPRWILQPLAENAIKHSAAYARGSAELVLAAHLVGDVIELTLSNDGPEPAEGAHEGIGLHNTRARLSTLYGDAASLVLRPRHGGGSEVVLRIPLQSIEGNATAEFEVTEDLKRSAFAGPATT